MDTRIVSIGVYQKRSSAKNTLAFLTQSRDVVPCTVFQSTILDCQGPEKQPRAFG